mmetsp:Transcript_17287/g.34875  ORF Transcript_17287/g.34875 Transcript_17287/m.34875 type:complete len:618 (-) Transcript_17287:150-2003(-)|eukprot:CAMPEP_0167786080 /NCGR_PEP_ID=MMETSP0111_2-20121227/8582_1 /TAXON_ID=91324 /ORGANISM="Lotharella globosa, Strain CCCM811" /LENGTH=617 /DNA_ID=CAMNT_0007677399 /DNA_START=96 /DNA_END=1949 /DNA_ORIENTATION=-
MSLPRKKQAEIERVLKRVQEGIIEFDNIWEKVRKATTPNLKEKYEGDLKKEIKKLQRYRDQIKSWASSSEITDKRPLLMARKSVEREMERFKVLEKESKTKKYSKEGLAQSGKKKKKDPRDEVYAWIAEKQDALREQVEEFEEQYEQATASGGTKGKKKRGGKNEQLETLNHWIGRHNWHLEQLDSVKSRLEKKEISIKQAKRIQEDLEYYIEENQEPDFVEDEYLYDAIDEEDEDEEEEEKVEEESEPEPEPEPEIEKKKPEPKKEPKKGKTKTKSLPVKASPKTADKRKSEDKKVAAKVEKQPSPKVQAKPAVKTSPVVKEKKGAHDSKVEASKEPMKPPEWQRSRSEPSAPQIWGSQGAGKGPTLATMLKKQEQISRANHQQKLQQEAKNMSHRHTSMGPVMGQRGGLAQVPLHPSKSVGGNVIMRGGQRTVLPGGPPMGLRKAQEQIGGAHSVRKESQPALGKKIITPSYMKNLQLLEASLRQMPESMDTERPKQYVPGNPYRTPSCFPDLPAPIFDDPKIFEKFDTDTLFFIFYFQQGTQHQYLAARELKKQSWRYHKKFLTWFQRHNDPKFKNEEYEQGTYVFFDYESGWCKRIKSDFTFEYCHLEDELRI